MNRNSAIWNKNYLTFKSGCLYALIALASFHLANAIPACSFLMVVFLFCWLQLARVRTSRQAMNTAYVIGLLLYGPQLAFFWTIFKGDAVVLWLVLCAWLGIFLVLQHLCWQRFGPLKSALLAPFLWLGLEYFRSELYYLRFSWFSIGFTFYEPQQLWLLSCFGFYGTGFVLLALAVLIALLPRQWAVPAGLLALISLAVSLNFKPVSAPTHSANTNQIQVAGVQLEFPSEMEVLDALKKLHARYPAAELLVLSEYTFDGPVPERIKSWCRVNKRYLIAGGKEPLPDGDFLNTVYVVNPEGKIAFQQVKMVPLQFFKDGRPATTQKIWASPWGKLGLCICYDLSYTRVIDGLVAQGAQAIIVPTMDVADWGAGQHRLHARVAPLRSGETGLPIFRIASSGISQLVDSSGLVVAHASFPGEDEMIAGRLPLEPTGKIPTDRLLARVSVVLAGALALWFAIAAPKLKLSRTLNPPANH